MLREAGGRWDDWRAFDQAVLEPARLDFFRGELARVVDEEYGDAPLFVLKDPRICRFVPLYEEVFTGAGITPRFIQVVRNPLAVAASLLVRDEMTRGFVELMWLRHNLEAESATRGKSRAFVPYGTFLHDWRSQVEQWARALDIVWPRSPDTAADEIRAFVSRDHRHHVQTLSDLEASPATATWVREAYPALLSLAVDPLDEESLAKLSHIRAEFDAFAPVLGDATFIELAHREARLMEVHRQAENRTTDARSEIERMRTALVDRDQDIAALEDQVARLSQGVAARDVQVATLSREITAQKQRVANLSQAIITANTQLARVYSSRSWRLTAPLRLLRSFLMRATNERFSPAVPQRAE